MDEQLAKERAQPPEYADMPRRAPGWDRADAYEILEQKKQWLSAPFVEGWSSRRTPTPPAGPRMWPSESSLRPHVQLPSPRSVMRWRPAKWRFVG